MQRSNNGRWKKRWVVLDSNYLHCFKKDTSGTERKIDLLFGTVKNNSTAGKYCFEVTIATDKTFVFDACNQDAHAAWCKATHDVCVSLLTLSPLPKRELDQVNSVLQQIYIQ